MWSQRCIDLSLIIDQVNYRYTYYTQPWQDYQSYSAVL